MSRSIFLADLTHTGQIVAANTVPLGISLIAAYAKEKLTKNIKVELFRYPEDLTKEIEVSPPQIIGFSNCSWNVNLSCEIARRVKVRNPEVIIIFGGPNYPTDKVKREGFLKKHPEIDFHIDGEGEEAFTELYQTVAQFNFDINLLKSSSVRIANTDYLLEGALVSGELNPRMVDLNQVPSPYLSGLNDKFFDDILIPMIQTSRGCPYSCTFCHEGSLYFNKVRLVNRKRVKEEIEYIAQRVQVPDFIIVDSNFGMFPEDIDTCNAISKVQSNGDWPRYVFVATAKNHKERVVQAAQILPGIINPGAAVQSTNKEVLAQVKRVNLPVQAIIDVAKTSKEQDANSFSEIILCLPGDTKEAHFESIFEMVDLGINYVRMYQFMMLPGTEADTPEYRSKYGMKTKFRVLPRCFGRYELFDETFEVAEIEEICISNSTMSFDDYLECRSFNLTVEVFYNGGIFYELLQLLEILKIAPSAFLKSIHERIKDNKDLFSDLYKNYQSDELQNQWVSESKIQEFFDSENIYDLYVDGQFGSNEIYAYRAMFIFRHMQEVHDLAFDTAREIIRENGVGANAYQEYLDDLQDFSLRRKINMLDTSIENSSVYNFDFVKLSKKKFTIDPLDVYEENGLAVKIQHDKWQKSTVKGYLAQYGDTINGLGRILLRSHVKRLYRQVEYNGKIETASELVDRLLVENAGP